MVISQEVVPYEVSLQCRQHSEHPNSKPQDVYVCREQIRRVEAGQVLVWSCLRRRFSTPAESQVWPFH